MRIGWLAAEWGVPISLGDRSVPVGVHLACALPVAATAQPAFATELTVWDWKSGDPLAASCCQQPKIPAAGGGLASHNGYLNRGIRAMNG
jgi:hypothetical protein